MKSNLDIKIVEERSIFQLNLNKTSIMNGITKSAIENFNKLISSEIYSVPRFQRDYSWKEPNWFDLWEDVKKILNRDYDEQYMGNLVLLQKEGSNQIIDGQQRLISISLMFLAFIKTIKSSNLNDHEAIRIVHLLKSKYIAEESITQGDFTNRLVLNENNNDLYNSFISERPLTRSKLNPSEKLLKKGLDWFTNKIKELDAKTPKELGECVNVIASSLYFTILHVADDLTAYIVFETLNARGVKLSSTDLFKNYLFQKISPSGEQPLRDIENKWRRIVNLVGSDEVVDFMRYYWNSRHKITRKVDLYREITIAYNTSKKVIELVDDLVGSAEIYSALIDPDNELWTESNWTYDTTDIPQYLNTLKLFRLKQPFVPLLIGKQVLDDKQFEKLLRYCVSFSFRYNIICDFSANDQEVFYNKLALFIKEKGTFSEKEFEGIYPNNETFRKSFESIEFPYQTQDMKIVRYILASIERKLFQNKKALPLFDEEMTIEHILSRSPVKTSGFKSDEHKKIVNKLGNLTLLSKSEQKQVGNSDFAVKFPFYQKSSYSVTNTIVGTSKDGWDKNMVEQRQQFLAKQAASIWYIPNLK